MTWFALAPLALSAFAPILPPATEAPTAQQEHHAPLFPPATGDLALVWDGDEGAPTMLDVVLRYGVLTDQTITIDPETRQRLRNERVPIQRSIQVPAAAAQGFVEALLAASDYVLTIDRETAPRLLQVHSLQSQARNTIRSKARYVDDPDLTVLREHPAVLFATRIHLPATDARVFANSMRSMITDSNTMMILPADNQSLYLVGFGPAVASLIDFARGVDSSTTPADTGVVHELVRLEHANAAEIAKLVERALEVSTEMETPPPSQTNQAGPQAPARRQTAGVLPHVRLNALLLTGTAGELAEAKKVIALLDVK